MQLRHNIKQSSNLRSPLATVIYKLKRVDFRHDSVGEELAVNSVLVPSSEGETESANWSLLSKGVKPSNTKQRNQQVNTK